MTPEEGTLPALPWTMNCAPLPEAGAYLLEFISVTGVFRLKVNHQDLTNIENVLRQARTGIIVPQNGKRPT
jgi:hypothetical protein